MTMPLQAMPNVYELFCQQSRRQPAAAALIFDGTVWSYADLRARVELAAAALRQRGCERGDRIAILSENSPYYTVLQMACAKIGVVVSCLNWRLRNAELQTCLEVVAPRLLACSARFAALGAGIAQACGLQCIEPAALCAERGDPDLQESTAEREDGLLAIFTSGTTGIPKAAIISHRAHIARMRVLQDDLHLTRGDAFIAWSPMFHMGGSEHTLSSLMFGAATIICDGLDVRRIAQTLASRKVGWLLLVPATIEPLLAELAASPIRVVGVKAVGCMADLVSRASIDAICKALHAPFLNSFGATETGLPPLSGHLLQPGAAGVDLAKRLNSHCELKLADAAGSPVAEGAVGEAWVRGPTLFSGYWRGAGLDRSVFRDDWYPMGDLFSRDQHGGYHFVGRSKYLIKSGGENIYPAEIERILLTDPRIEDAAVVRKPDATWGEVPVAFIIRRDESLQAADVDQLCRDALASYKRPKEIHFVAADTVARNASGKIMREELERRLAK